VPTILDVQKKRKQEQLLNRILRIIFTILGGALGYGLAVLLFFIYNQTPFADSYTLTLALKIAVVVILALIGLYVFYKISPKIVKGGQNLAGAIDESLRSVSLPDLLTGTGGLIVGLVIAYLVSSLFNFMNNILSTVVSVVLYLFFGYLGVTVATHRGPDIIRSANEARENRPKSELKLGKKKGSDNAPKILDTSVIVDGRIADILKTGFLEGRIVIPDFVLIELQHIADSSDSMKRQRGRRGLDILNRIREDYGIEIYGTEKEKGLAEIPEVDIKLLKLAQIMNAKVVTNDYNLNKVATITGVSVMNINDLANVLKPVVLPGEPMQVFVIKEGKEPNQGVAYLDDGTMIVVENGAKRIGKTIDVTVTSVLQTSAGRMIFAKE
jgi:uncharacterized protein YacL